MNGTSSLSRPETWDAVASGYADDVMPVFSLYAREALRLARLPAGARILDVATGPGTLALLAAEAKHAVVAVDFSDEMIRECRARTTALPNVEVLKADGQDLPFPDSVFDGVFSMFGLIFFPDREAGFLEARRVLKPGGRIVVSSWAPLDGVPLLAATFEALADLLPELPFGEGDAPLADEHAVFKALREAGFQDVAVHTFEHRVETPSVAAFWTVNERSSAPINLIRRQVDETEWEAIGAGVVKALERTFGRGPVTMTWPARLGVGRR